MLYPRVECAINCGGEIRTRIDSFTRRALSAVELRRNNLMEWERIELSPNSLQNCRSAELSYHPEIDPRKIGCGGGTRTRALSLMRRMLCRLSYSAKRTNLLAGLAGLEPAATRLEDERSCPSELQTPSEWRRRWESNPQPAVYETAALPVGATSPLENWPSKIRR